MNRRGGGGAGLLRCPGLGQCDQAIHGFDRARYLCAEEIASVYAFGNCQIDPAIRAAGDIDTLAVTMLMESGRMVLMTNNRRGPWDTTSGWQP